MKQHVFVFFSHLAVIHWLITIHGRVAIPDLVKIPCYHYLISSRLQNNVVSSAYSKK